MRVLVLGGTGSIGGPVVRELIRRGHDVVALARSAASAQKLADLGAATIAGDISTPDQWLGALQSASLRTSEYVGRWCIRTILRLFTDWRWN
jgi:uncharacterized protein YbjT (DUF2867 family)